MGPAEHPKQSIEATRLLDVQIIDTINDFPDSVLSASLLAPPRSEGEIGWLQHYRVLRQLGRGGMGIVFLAEDVHLRRLVALKVMHRCFLSDMAAQRRFLREAQAMAAIQHEHVAIIYQVGTEIDHDRKRIPFIAMQYLKGETLQDRMVRQPPLNLAEVLRIGKEIAEGLGAAHAQGMVHRDIKPTNIWLAQPHGKVKLLDFGLARLLETTSSASSLGQVVGSVHFMSPEQFQGENVDARSDLFSLGCVLYTLLARKLPFDGPTPTAILNRLTYDEPAPLLSCRPHLPVALAQLVHGLLAKSPADRPQDAATVQARLAELELQCRNERDPITVGSTGSGSGSSALPVAASAAFGDAAWAAASSTLRDWPSFRIALRYRRQPSMWRRSFLLWGALAATAGISAAAYVFLHDNRKQPRPDATKRGNKSNR
ncbi:MAG TPA: serine/threonine-protein kinase [Gemmataceae bacterium]|nr:serine/threonine-protein kinase [Gemmataceae bacterium]